MTSQKKKIVIIGIDGLDFKLTNSFLRQGRLPHLAKLKKNGFYSSLETTIPPQSPVAWASFITGKPPAQHGIFDFIVRDPKNYLLSPVFSPTAKKSILKAIPFWQQTTQAKIPTEIYFLPVTYPPEKIHGQMISGMGTPDILGTEGTLTLLTTDKKRLYSPRGTRIEIKNSLPKIETFINGPKYQTLKSVKTAQIPLTISQKKDKDSLQIQIQNQTFSLKKGSFSPWVKLKFKLGAFRSVHGLAKFFLSSIRPHLNLHLSPINIDPFHPIFPISSPPNLAQKLTQKHGLFSTLGLPHDTWALQENIFSEKDFLIQAETLLQEKEKIIFDQLANFKQGLFVAYFGTLDSVQHMFLRNFQKKEPFGEVIPQYYQKMDQLIGKTMELIAQDTELIVLSDHGFAHFDWEVNLNSWLRDNGFLTLKSGFAGEALFANVHWQKTQAFAAGFNSLYLNVKNRETEGIVSPEKKEKLAQTIKIKLKKFIHPATKQPVIKNVYTKKELGIPEKMDSPDLIIGFHLGFRASWETAVGATPAQAITKRTQKWGADHLFDASEIPGVIFSNQNLGLKNPAISQIMPLVLKRIK